MPVVEYKMHRVNGSTRRAVPDFIGNRGHFQSPIDSTYVGWVDANPDYYVPDTIVSLTKDEFVTRQLGIHNGGYPFFNSQEDVDSDTPMTDAEATTFFGDWYDNFVTENS